MEDRRPSPNYGRRTPRQRRQSPRNRYKYPWMKKERRLKQEGLSPRRVACLTAKNCIRGSRMEVWQGKADHTVGGLTRNDLKMNDRGRLVSVKASLAAKRRYSENPDMKDMLVWYQWKKKTNNEDLDLGDQRRNRRGYQVNQF